MTRLQTIGAYIVGAVFLLSGVGKALNVLLFQSLIHSYGLPYLDLLAPVVVAVELVLAFLFFVRDRLRTVSLWSIVLLLLFTGVYTFGYTRQGVTDCGCFGIIRLPDISPVYVYIRNGILLVLLNVLVFTAPDKHKRWNSTRWTVFCLYMASALFCTGMTYRPAAYLPSENHHPLQGAAVAQTAMADIVPGQESVMVLLYSYQCSHCLNTMENFLALQRYGRVDTVIAVAVVPEDEDIETARETFRHYYPNLGQQEIQADALPQIKELPTALLVENDTVQQVIVGELPNPYLIETHKTKITQQ